MPSNLNIEVTIKEDSSGTSLFEEYDSTTRPALRKRKSRNLRQEYKQAMKDAARFDKTHMSHANHPTLFMVDQDKVTFFHAKEFYVGVGRDPEIEEDFSSPDSPFTDNGGTPWTMPQKATQQGGTGDKTWQAGPYKINKDSGNQRFYKFTIWTAAHLVLDPDIVIEP